MKFVEHSRGGFQWGEPLRKATELDVKQVGDELHIIAHLPRYEVQDHPSDLIRQYEIVRKDRSIGKQRTGKDSPHICFANANTDEKLIAFVRRYGPVVAKSVYTVPDSTHRLTELTEKRLAVASDEFPLLIARQDMQELQDERRIYQAALSLVVSLRENFDFLSAQHQIGEIAAHIGDWPRQWERERSQCERQPLWRLDSYSLKRIKQLSSSPPDGLLPPDLDARIVISEVLNVFRATVFPHPAEMHHSIKCGIRPLLYSILRHEFLYPHDVGTCANTQCRQFFEVERAGQKYCDAQCSLRQRQRDYWKERGKRLRKKRMRNKKSA